MLERSSRVCKWFIKIIQSGQRLLKAFGFGMNTNDGNEDLNDLVFLDKTGLT